MRRIGTARPSSGAPSRLASARRASGTTLVELATVLAVLGVLAGLAVPSLGWITDARRNVAATRARNALVYAQRWAVATRRAVWADFDVAGNRLSLFVDASAAGGPLLRQPLLDPLTREPFVLELDEPGTGFDDVRMAGDQSVQFDAEGTPSAGDGASFTSDGLVRMSGGSTLRVVQQTGLVLVE